MRLLRTLLPTAAVIAACGLFNQAAAATPEDMGMSSEGLDAVLRQLQGIVDSGALPGAALVVHRGGQQVYAKAVGLGDRELGVPMRVDTICRLMSQSKPLTSVAAMILVERGLLSLKDPISKWNRQFRYMKVQGANGLEDARREILVEDLFQHTAGFGYAAGLPGQGGGGDNEMSAISLMFQSLDDFVNDLAGQPLVTQPGTRWQYSWAVDVLGWVVEKVSRQPLDVFMRANIFAPLRMVDTDFFVPQAKFSRYMPAYTMNENGVLVPLIRPGWDLLQGYRTPAFVSGGAGIVSTALDYARFAQMLLNGGELDGQRVLKAESVDAMWHNVLPAELLPINMNGWTSDPNTGWANGWTISTTEPTLNVDWATKTGGDRTGTIGWGGGAMTNWLASADQDMLISFTTQRLSIPAPNTFQEVVVAGVFKSITAPPPRPLPGVRRPANNGDFDLPAGAGGDDNTNPPDQPTDGQQGEVEIDPGNGNINPTLPNGKPKTEQQLRKERERAEKARQRDAERARKTEERERKKREKQAEILRKQQQQALQQQAPQYMQEQALAAIQAQQQYIQQQQQLVQQQQQQAIQQQQQLARPGPRSLRADN